MSKKLKQTHQNVKMNSSSAVRDCTAGRLVIAKSGRLDLGDDILQTL